MKAKTPSVVLSVRISEELRARLEKVYSDIPIKSRPASISSMVRHELDELYLGRVYEHS